MLEALYSEIPTFTCREGCTDCCGSMPFVSGIEWDLVPEKRQHDELRCPYLNGGQEMVKIKKTSAVGITEAGGSFKVSNGKCEIYEHRPFICRLFGSVEGFQCIHGYGPENPLSVEQGRDLRKRYFTFIEQESEKEISNAKV